MVGTQFHQDRVVRLTPGDKVTPIVSLQAPKGIAAYPPIIPSLGTVVYVTSSPTVRGLIHDAYGKRLRADLVTGTPVNDFGSDGFDSGAGPANILAIKNPAPGAFKLDIIGLTNAPYEVHISTADVASQASARILLSGDASPDLRFAPAFKLGAQSSLAFVPRLDGITHNDASATVSFTAVAGKTYRLERKSDLGDAAWQSIQGVQDVTVSTNGVVQLTDPATAFLAQAFYRIHVLP
jgi:hypothetical protein